MKNKMSTRGRQRDAPRRGKGCQVMTARLRRSRNIVLRHVREYEAAVGAAGYVINSRG